VKPPEVAEAEMVDILAMRYHVLPEIAAESDPYNIRHLIILNEAGIMAQQRGERPPGPEQEDPWLTP
jgi:hypothetical protein